MVEVKIETKWDLTEITSTLAKTMEYASQDSLKVYEHQYGSLDLYIKKLEKIKDALKADILQEFEKRFSHQGYTYTNDETGGILQRVIQIRTDVDQDKVKKLLDTDQYNMVKKEIVDIKKFFGAIKLGVIPAYIVQEVVTEQEIDKLSWKEVK